MIPSRLFKRLDSISQKFYTDKMKVVTTANTSYDEYGAPIPTETAGSEINCSFLSELAAKDAFRGEDYPLHEYDGVVRVPASTTVTVADQVTITECKDRNVTDKTYDVMNIEERGEFGKVLFIKVSEL